MSSSVGEKLGSEGGFRVRETSSQRDEADGGTGNELGLLESQPPQGRWRVTRCRL